MFFLGTKNVAKSMKEIACGKTEGKSWFVELSDKFNVSLQLTCESQTQLLYMYLGKSTKVYLYYYMKNCTQSPTKLRESILNIVNHYQVSQNHIVSFLYMSLHKQFESSLPYKEQAHKMP